jgi:hypothetical protein
MSDPTDEELVAMMIETAGYPANMHNRNKFALALVRIRPMLEARGIEMAAAEIESHGTKLHPITIAVCLRNLARQHSGDPS